jgi:hypothetical protein
VWKAGADDATRRLRVAHSRLKVLCRKVPAPGPSTIPLSS